MSKLERLRNNITVIENALKYGVHTDPATAALYSGFGGLNFILNPTDDKSAWKKSDLQYLDDVKRLQKILSDNSRDKNEYEMWMQSLKASVLTAFYTPDRLVEKVVGTICKTAKPRNVLDPAAGARGQFLTSAVPYARWFGVNRKMVGYEIDALSGLILAYTHQAKWEDIRIKGFETIPDKDLGSFDLVATNVPFGAINVYDKAYTNSDNAVRREAAKMIHRYYVLKGLDCLREGGVLAYIITSNYLNNDTEQVQEALKTSRLIGAYRLANNLFKESGTEVGTDLLVLQKDSNRGELSDAEFMLLAGGTENGCPTNFYFTCYPDHVIATGSEVGTDAYGKPGLNYYHTDGVNGIASMMGEVLAKDMKANCDCDLYRKNQDTSLGVRDTPKPKRMTKQERALKQIYECYTALYNKEQQEMEADAETRTQLNVLYDQYVDVWGKLNVKSRDVVKRMGIADVLALEAKDAAGVYQKADIMLHPVAFATEESAGPITAHEALARSLNDYGTVDVKYICGITGLDISQMYDELKGEIFFNPIAGAWEIKSRFISGNVIEKLDKIKKMFPDPSDNAFYVKDAIEDAIEALEKSVPEPIPFADLDFNLGERWVDETVYGKFASDFFSMPETHDKGWRRGAVSVTVHYEPTVDQFVVDANSYNEKIWSQYAVRSEASRQLNGMDLLTHALHNTTPKMMKYLRDNSGRIVYDDQYNKIKIEDAEKTQQAAAKIEEIRQGYVDWLQRQPADFREHLADVYNRRFNCFVKPKYDGSHQTFPDIDMAGLKAKYGIERLYDTQKDCVWMLKLNGGGICDHEVGSGKTLIMCIAAHEMKRLGLAHKPMIIGLKANVSAIAETYQTAYPNAKILFAKESDYSAGNRVDFFNRMRTGDYDCVIMSHDQFGKIPQSDAIQKELINDELCQIDEALNVLSSLGYGISSKMRKGLEQRKRNMKAKLDKLQDAINNRKDDVVDFEQMGIDHIFVDESHQFKNLGFSTRHDRVAGLGNTEGSKRAFNMLMAIRTIQKRTGKDLGATFLSGTTVTNSLTELYSLFRYLRPNALHKQNIRCFDAWAAIFTKKSAEYEFNITNAIVMKERFRYFIKVPELAMFYNEITDFRTADDVGIDRPKRHAMLLNIKPTPDQEAYIETLIKFAKTGDFSLIGIMNPTDQQRKAKMLYATDQARKMSLDMRLIDPSFGDHPNSKASRCAELIHRYYEAFSEQKGTQLVFSDLSTWQNNTDWCVYYEIKHKLVTEYGLKPSEVRFIQEAKNDKAKQALIQQVNDGEVRVLFGSTSMLGTGVNAQRRVVAVHHLDTPWRPSDLEQRDGRAVRKGNDVAKIYAGNKVDVIIYAVERSLDSYKFNLLDCKQRFINQLKRGQLSIRTLDEGAMDENTGMNFAEYMAVLSGNTDLLERAKLEKKIAGLESERKSFYRSRQEQEQKREKLIADIERDESGVKQTRADLATFEKVRKVTADGTVYNDIRLADYDVPADIVVGSKEWIDAIGKELQRIDREVTVSNGDYKTIGTIYGFPIMMKTVQAGMLDNSIIYGNRFFVKVSNVYYQHSGGKMSRASFRLSAEYPLLVLQNLPALISQMEERIIANRASIEQLDAILENKWGKEKQLINLRTELSALDRKINEELKKENPQQPVKKAA